MEPATAAEQFALNSLDAVVAASPITQLALATVFLVIIIFVHGIGIRLISDNFAHRFALERTPARPWRVNLLFAVTISAMVGLHFFETLLWTIPLQRLGLIPNFWDAYYFVLQTYTTLGNTPIQLPNHWRMVGPVMAISGLFTFGWTGSVLVNVMNELAKLRAAKTRAGLAGKAGTPPPD